LLLILVTLPSINLFSQSNKNNGADKKESILFSINNLPTYTEEFKYVYNKNNVANEDAFTKEDIEEYLELFINFKLKVTEARGKGYDTTKAYRDELNKYQDQLASPYLTEKEVTQALIKEAYVRYQFEVDVSHVLITVDDNASPQDTLLAFNKAMNVWEQARVGADFEKLVLEYSEEPAIEKTLGHLGYFTALQMVYPFESTAFETPVGEVSRPVRTKFGYHVIKVRDMRPTNGKVTVGHIMLRFKPSTTAQDSIDLENKILSIHEQATSGYDWNQLCKEQSEDYNTRDKGGTLPAFGVGEMIPNLAEVAFTLKDSLEISNPVMTPYGWHILRLENRTPLGTFEELEPQLSQKIKRDSRSNKSKEALITRLTEENKFIENLEVKNSLFSSVDSISFTGEWVVGSNPNPDMTLFSVGDSTFRVENFVDYVNKKYRNAGTGHASTKINRLYSFYVREELINYEKAHLEEKYEDYRYLMNEYREGILLFEIMEKEIWSKSGSDSVGLEIYYRNNLMDYKVKERASLITFEVANGNEVQELIDALNILSNDTSFTLTKVREEIEKKYPLVAMKNMGDYEVVDQEWATWMSQGRGVYDLQEGDSTQLTMITEYEPETTAELNDIKGMVISDYQDFLDKQWIGNLRKKYSVEVNKKERKKLYKELEN